MIIRSTLTATRHTSTPIALAYEIVRMFPGKSVLPIAERLHTLGIVVVYTHDYPVFSRNSISVCSELVEGYLL